MVKIKESPYGCKAASLDALPCTETYTVKFWYTNQDGYRQQGEEDLYCNSKSAHKDVEKYFLKTFSKRYKNPEVISVTYN